MDPRSLKTPAAGVAGALLLGLGIAWWLMREIPSPGGRAAAARPRPEAPSAGPVAPSSAPPDAGKGGSAPSPEGPKGAAGAPAGRAVVRVRVVEAPGDQPLEGIEVRISAQETPSAGSRAGSWILHASTDAGGAAELALEGSGPWSGWISLGADARGRDLVLGGSPPRRFSSLRAGMRHECELRLERGGGISGKIEIPGGEPMPAQIQLLCSPRTDEGSIRTGTETATADIDREARAYRVRGLLPRDYYVFVGSADPLEASDLEPAVRVETGRVAEGPAIQLVPKPVFHGRITGPAGEPLAKAILQISSEDGFMPNVSTVVTGEDGSFRAVLSHFTRWASIQGPSADRPPAILVRSALKDAWARGGDLGAIRLGSGATLSGRVLRDETGEAVQGAEVQAEMLREPFGWSDQTSRSVRTVPSPGARAGLPGFDFKGLPPGKVRLTAAMSGLVSDPVEMELKEGEAAGPVELRLKPRRMGSVSGSILWGDTGSPAAGICVAAYPADRFDVRDPVRTDGQLYDGYEAAATTDPSGAFRLDGLKPGPYVLFASVHHEGRTYAARSEVEIRPDSAPVLSLTLSPR